MALTDTDPSEPLAALHAGEMTDTIHSSLDWVLQQLIEAEVTDGTRSASATYGKRPSWKVDGRGFVGVWKDETSAVFMAEDRARRRP